MGLLSVISLIGFLVIFAGLFVAVLGFCTGFGTQILRDIRRGRQHPMERNILKLLSSLRSMSNPHMRMIKEATISTYGSRRSYYSNELYCQVMCEIIDRLIVGKRMEDRDVRTIINTFEAWNGKEREAVPTSST